MRAILANLNHCAVPLLSRAAANFCWYYSTIVISFNAFNYTFITDAVGRFFNRKVTYFTIIVFLIELEVITFKKEPKRIYILPESLFKMLLKKQKVPYNPHIPVVKIL